MSKKTIKCYPSGRCTKTRPRPNVLAPKGPKMAPRRLQNVTRRPQSAPRRLNNANITEYPEHQSPITEIPQDGFKTPKSSFRILAQVLPKSFQILSFLTLLLHGLPSGYNHIGGVFSGGRGRRCIAGGVFDKFSHQKRSPSGHANGR